MKDLKKTLLLICLMTYTTIAFSKDSFDNSNTKDTSIIYKIDSILNSIKEKKLGKK